LTPDRLIRLVAAIALAGSLAAGCAGTSPAATPSPVPSAPMTEGQIRLFLGERLGPNWFCDPDEFPVGRDAFEAAQRRFGEVRADADLYLAILEVLGLDPSVSPTDDQKFAIYRTWKAARAISLEAIGEGRYRYDYLVRPRTGQTQGLHVVGAIDAQGVFSDQQEEPAGEPNCPICLSFGTVIDASDGPVAVEQLRLGDALWTLDAGGHRIQGTVIALGSTKAPPNHHVVRLVLADGRSVLVSPGHPLVDGRRVGDLRVGDALDGSTVVRAELVPYSGESTFDLLVSGATGAYFAGGIPLGSTLRP
jgi:hypothetical protein